MSGEQRAAPPAGRAAVSRLRELDRRTAGRQIALTLARSIIGAAAFLAAYYLVPRSADSARQVVIRLLLLAVGVAAVLAWQVIGIMHAALPQLRAVESLAVTVTVMVVAFASAYLLMSGNNPGAFSEELNHTGALYFTITTLATVGYGDIHARSDGARVVVMVQMVFNVAVIGASARLILTAARRRAEGQR